MGFELVIIIIKINEAIMSALSPKTKNPLIKISD